MKAQDVIDDYRRIRSKTHRVGFGELADGSFAETITQGEVDMGTVTSKIRTDIPMKDAVTYLNIMRWLFCLDCYKATASCHWIDWLKAIAGWHSLGACATEEDYHSLLLYYHDRDHFDAEGQQ